MIQNLRSSADKHKGKLFPKKCNFLTLFVSLIKSLLNKAKITHDFMINFLNCFDAYT